MKIGSWIGILVGAVIIAIIIGIIIGFKISNKMTKKQLEENPPITEEQIRSMYAQMGRKPSEQQIRQIMNNFKRKVNDK
ncbi:MAG: YneF family protein [Mycoplasma sp.]|nr:YneF family protein [Mycoplasma sp.]